ncbi:hypothetical protein DPSP01_003587 [Paraphaeosphaeria sporulosa]|uniref:Uncharacterized protein n=1 Tax=Paraphaeosphaeria sporulosa TaxID=1460663 RepID=A0A177BYF6_9PLEO|nr:uncharacterized protein CC84DRAFT_403395 [Paraphaeosphaeria sporulosa]OAF99446.1 hypothetical protein CC84DRAFT_403395 [Paraphaeosphaeria sporulosa]
MKGSASYRDIDVRTVRRRPRRPLPRTKISRCLGLLARGHVTTFPPALTTPNDVADLDHGTTALSLRSCASSLHLETRSLPVKSLGRPNPLGNDKRRPECRWFRPISTKPPCFDKRAESTKLLDPFCHRWSAPLNRDALTTIETAFIVRVVSVPSVAILAKVAA